MPRRRRASDCRTREQLDALRKSRRDEKRRQRDRLFARGLDSLGRPLSALARAQRDTRLVNQGRCPTGCPCFDCLGFARDDRAPRALQPCRVAIAARR